MKNSGDIIILTAFILLTITSSVNKNTETIESEVSNKHPVIIDTDFASDADDVLAVRLALCYEDMGLLDVKGIMLSTNNEKSPNGVSSLCEYDGYYDVPIGMNTNWRYSVKVPSVYVDVLCDYGGEPYYTDTTKLYRKLLSESDGKVSILTLGFLQNIQCLMNSEPDEYSPLGGMELIAEKVDTLYILGGNLNGYPSFNFYWTGDITNNAARYVNEYYPGDIIYLPTELGQDVVNGAYYQTDPFKNDPVSAVLEVNDQKDGIIGWDTAGVYGMMHVMLGDYENESMMLYTGYMLIEKDGKTTWETNEDSNSNRMILRKTGNGQYYSDAIDNILYDKFNNSRCE